MNRIRILLVEEDPAETSFLREALEESQEALAAGTWTALEVTATDTLEDAVAVAQAGDADVVLLDPLLARIAPFNAFAELRNAAPEVPVILLLGNEEEALASRFLRDGAQDYLIKSEIDCKPLARAIRNAVDRHRYVNAFRRGSSFDELTGLLNQRGFHGAATRELHLAAGAGQPVLLVLAEIDNLSDIAAAYGPEQRELTLLDGADLLRESAGNTALLACLDGHRFAALAWNTRPDDFIGRVQNLVARRPRQFAFRFGWASTHPGASESLDPLLTAAEASLCDNEEQFGFLPETSRSTPPTASAKACPA